MTPGPLAALDTVYWARAAHENGFVTTFAIDASADVARRIADDCLPRGARISFSDSSAGLFRSASIDGNDAISGIVVVGSGPLPPPSAWLKGMLQRNGLSISERRALLAGCLPDGAVDAGPIVCVCHQVSANRISDVIAQGCVSAEAVGKSCNAGTNCGSCLPEINRILSAAVSAAKDSRAAVTAQ